MRTYTRTIVLLTTLMAAEAAFAQTQTPQIGLPPFGSFHQTEFDRIDASNANVHFDIPIVRRAGRGMDLWRTLTFDSSIWSVSYDPTSLHSMWIPNIGANWGWSNRSSGGFVSYNTTVSPCNQSRSSNITTRTNYVYHDSNGTTHLFSGAAAVYKNECSGIDRIGFAATNAPDQSGYYLAVASTYFMEPTVTYNGITITSLPQADGYSVFETGGAIQDTNGNLGPDTLGTGGSTLTYPSPTNPANLVGVTLNWTQYSVKTNFGCQSIYEYGPLNIYLITSVVMADGSTYTIGYEATPGYPGNVTGRIASIHLPSGGTITYTYSGSNNGMVCGEGSPAILQRTTPDGTWTYNRSVSIAYLGYGQYGQPGAVTTTITDPLSNITVVNSLAGLEFKRQIYQGSTTLLQTVETCYNGAAFPCTSGGLPITRKTVRLEIPNSAGLVSQTDTTYSAAGLVTDVSEYDFGTGGPPATPLRTSHTDYATLGNGILNRPSAVTVKDGSGNIKAQTTYGYDETAVTPTTGTPNLVSVSGSRGNATTITRLVQGSSTVHQTKTYYDTGNPLVVKDFAGNPTTYAYGTASCGNSFPTQTTDALGHIISMVWDCNGAVKTSVTDANQQQTAYIFGDPNFWRLTQTNYPDGGQATATYNLGIATPWNIVSTSKINAAQTLNKTNFYDSLGRVTQSQLTSDPQGTIFTDTTYDALGRTSTVSNPYRSTSDPTYGITTTQYDGLSRVTKVIPPDGTSTSNNISTAYAGNTTTVTDHAGKSRKSVADGLGRLIEVDEPGVVAPATSGTGSGTLSGSEQSIGGVSATAGTGSVSFSGTLQSKQVQTQAATPATGTVTISGGPDRSTTYNACPPNNCYVTVNDGGPITVTVNGIQAGQTSYGNGSTTSGLASALASAINANSSSPVTASASGATVNLTTKTTGASANWSLSATSVTSNTTYYTAGSTSFPVSTSGAYLTGGANAVYTTRYDSGSSTITVNGHNNTVSWSGSATTPSSIASALALNINADSAASVTASASGATVSLTAKTTGISTNYSLTSSWTYDSADFSSSSFTSSNSGSALSGGSNGAGAVYDSGSVWIMVNGTQATASYGQGDTAASVASRLQSAMGLLPVTVSLSGSTLNLTATTTGTASNYSLSAGSSTSQPGSFSQPSFTMSVSGSTFTGGADAVFSLSNPAVTLYTYDTLGNLICAVQKGTDTTAFTTCAAAPATWRPRSFTYNLLSRLLTSTNPEVGTITYTYDANSNVATKKDARNITTTYGYDVLNRPITTSYSNGDPGVSLTYDQVNCLGLSACSNVGHRTSMTDAAGSESWSYQVDPSNLRSLHKEQRTTSGITKSATYTFDLDAGLTSVVYPTGRTVNYTYDNAGRSSTAADSANGITYASGTCGTSSAGVCYAPQGALASARIGISSSFPGGLNLTNSYNNRLQPLELKASSTGGNAMDITYNFNLGTGNNGHVYGITNNLDSTRSQTFAYDALNRLTSALTTSTHATSAAHCWGEAYGLDAWGNLQSISATTNSAYVGCSQESGFSKTPDGSNHLSGLSYDASGNTTNDGVNGYTWDGESQLKSAAGVTYLYDGDGRRVSKSNGNLYWYGSGGDILAETDAAGNTTAEYIFFGGKRVAMLPAGSTPIYYVEDLLGTSRVTTTNTGLVCYDADFYPYGGERTVTSTCPQNNYKFEGKERDTETGNDEFGARYYSNRFGRWLSADWSAVPVPVPYANLTNPQTLNLYSMVGDDPESFADLDGHTSAPAGGCIAAYDVCLKKEQEERAAARERQAAAQAAAPPQNQNAGQLAKDEAIGIAKEVANTVIGITNLVDNGINALLGTNLQTQEFKPTTPGEKSAMLGTSVALLLVPGGGEEKAATKVGSLAADAEKLYPKLAGKFQEHHIIPQYLGGAKDGATARIPAAYHQLITNAFRDRLAYGVKHSAEAVQQTVKEVYRLFPLP